MPLLREAFGELTSIEAMHLGNWLTDVSQAIDPVAYAGPAKKVAALADVFRSAFEEALDEALGAMVEYLPVGSGEPARRILARMRDILVRPVDAIRNEILSALEYAFTGRTDERDSRVGEFFRSIFFVIGYFKFVHPEVAGTPPRMDFNCFARVFGRLGDTRGAAGASPAIDRPGAYTQYYPHEHLDRPEILPSQDPAVYSPGKQVREVENPLKVGARPGTRAAGSSHEFRPDLYSYLRNDLEMTAGLLAEVDRDIGETLADRGFGPPFTDKPRLAPLDRDPTWHICLARLGHALHQVEDFFAHSNWVELAAQRRGRAYIDKVLRPPTPRLAWLNRARTVVAKRLKRHLTVQEKDWRTHPDEAWVVTGYFDLNDTIISLLHLTEEAWGGHVPDPYGGVDEALKKLKEARENPSAVVASAQRLLRETLEFVGDPAAAQKDPDNRVAKLYRERVGKDLDRLRQPAIQEDMTKQVAQDSPLLANAPPEVRDAFFKAIVLGSRFEGTLNLYKSIKAIGEFVSNPVGWLLKLAPDNVRDAVVFYARERLYDAIAMSRIGCHSLMAKDHGPEPLYGPNKQCATAVHYFIVKTLLRFRESGAPPRIDWLELLEFFLRNPSAPRGGATESIVLTVNVEHVVKAGEQLDTKDARHSLAKMYRAYAVDPANFSWRTIADANFNTAGLPEAKARRIVNETLRDRGWGYPVTPPNYAFKAGVRLKIPGQKFACKVPVATGAVPEWYEAVMDKDWTVFRGSTDPATGVTTPPQVVYRPRAISQDAFDTIVFTGRRMRIEAREAYRPATRQRP